MIQTQRPDPQYSELIRKLRVRPLSSWEFGDRISQTRAALQELAALAARSRGVNCPEVPEIGAHALADQLAVLIGDAQDAEVEPARVAEVVERIAAVCGLTGSGGANVGR